MTENVTSRSQILRVRPSQYQKQMEFCQQHFKAKTQLFHSPGKTLQKISEERC